MLLKIDLQEDTELRKSVKDLVQGQVKAVIRDEIADIVRAKVESLLKELADGYLRTRIEDIIGDRWGKGPLNQAFQAKLDHIVSDKMQNFADTLDRKEIIEKVALQIAKKFNV